MEIKDLVNYSDRQKEILQEAKEKGIDTTFLTNPEYTASQLLNIFELLKYDIDPSPWIDKINDNVTLSIKRCGYTYYNSLDYDTRYYDVHHIKDASEEELEKGSLIVEGLEIRDDINYDSYFGDFIEVADYDKRILGAQLFGNEIYDLGLRPSKDDEEDENPNIHINYTLIDLFSSGYEYCAKLSETLHKLSEDQNYHILSIVTDRIVEEYDWTGRLDIMIDDRYTIRERENILYVYLQYGIDGREIKEVHNKVSLGVELVDYIIELPVDEKQYYRKLSNQFRKERVEQLKQETKNLEDFD